MALINDVESKIFMALATQLDTYVTAHPIAVAVQGIGAKPTVKHLEPILLPAETTSVGMKGKDTKRHAGIFQISVYYPQGSGIVPALKEASAIIQYFKHDTRLYNNEVAVRIGKPPSIAPVVEEPTWVHVPISVPYSAFVKEI